jgi:hypothetical protein
LIVSGSRTREKWPGDLDPFLKCTENNPSHFDGLSLGQEAAGQTNCVKTWAESLTDFRSASRIGAKQTDRMNKSYSAESAIGRSETIIGNSAAETG